MRAQIEQLVQTVTMNIGYPISLENLGILHDHTFYFDICLIIFPEFNIKIIKIGQDPSLTPSQKLQKLLELLTQELQINLAALSATQILNGHSLHLYHFLNVLKQCSYLPPVQPSSPQEGSKQRINSCPSLHEITKDIKQPKSARQNPKQRNLTPSHIDQQVNDCQQPVDSKNQDKENSLAADEPQINNMKEKSMVQKKNIEKRSKKNLTSKKIIKNGQLVNTYCGTNKKYTNLLQKLMRGNKQKEKKEKQKICCRSKNTIQSKADWKRQAKDIDDFFKSFELKIRDQKQKYLRKMEQLVRDQQNQRMRLQRKLNLEKSRQVQQKHAKAIQSMSQSHNIRKSVIKQHLEDNKEAIRLLRKQQEKQTRASKKQLKVRRQKQLKQIKNYITQMNNKILMKLQDGGELQKMVMDIYKKL